MEDFFSFYCKNNKPVELEPNKDDSLFDLDDNQDTVNDNDNGLNDQDNNTDLKDKIAELEEIIKNLTSKDKKDGEE